MAGKENTHIVVDIPGLIQLRHFGILTEPLAVFARRMQIMAKALHKRALAQRLGALRGQRVSAMYRTPPSPPATHLGHHFMQRFQYVEHAVRVMFAKVELGCFLEAFMPLLMP